NSRHEYMTGYSSKELLQRNMMDWFKDDYESQNNIDSALNTMALKGYGEAEAKLQKKNGSRIPVYFTFSALKMNDSQYFTGIGMDITRIKKAEEKIKESYTVLRIAGEKAQLGGWSADLSNNKVYWSDEVAVLHEMPVGYSPSVEDGINFYAPEWREKMAKIFNDCARNGIPYDVEMEIITASGKRVWIETIAEAVKDDAGNIIKIQGAFQNISERRKVNKSLQQERELYFDLVNNQPAGIYRIRVLPMNKWEKDAWTNSKKSPYIMELASDRFCEILGITRHDFEVNPFIIDDLVYPQDKSDFKLRNEEANAKLIPFRWEGRMLIQDKICWVHLESIPRQVENGEILWTGILYDISENKQTELALKESDERFQMLFNQAPLGYQSLDINGNFLEVNKQWLETLGYKRDEVIGKWFGDFLTPMYQDGFRQRFPIFKAQGHIHSEFEMLHKNGSILFIAFEGRIGKDLNGNFKQTHCILQDITESKRANEVLIKSREDFMDLFDNAPIGYHEIDAGGRIVRMNQTELNMLGYTFGELVGKHFWSTITEEKVSRKAIEAKLSGEYIPHNFFEREFRKKDGTTLSVLLKDKIFKDKDGHITGIRTTVQDITERKKAESALIESEEKFKNIFEHSAVGKSLTTIDGKLKVNYAFRKILGYSEEELYLKNWKEITYKDDIEYNDKTVKSILRGERVSSQWEKRYIHKNGSIVWVDITTTLQRDKTGNPLFFITEITDITERKEVESALLESEKEYRNLLDMSPVAKCILHDWTLIYVNHSAIKLFGAKSSKDLVNKPILELIHPDFHILTHENAKLLAKKGFVPKQEQRFIRIDGHVLDVETQSKSIRFNGKLATLVDISDITDRKKAEYELLINSKRLNALVKILQSPADSIQNYLDLALNQAIEMTDSKLGYIYHYSETKKEFVLNSWSKEVMNECKVQEKQTVYQLEKTGLWGEVVRQRKPIMVNDFQAAHPLKKGQPGGHAPLHKYLTIPVIVDNQIVGVVGVANKETDYVDNDIKQLTVLMDIVWNALGKRQTDISLQISEEKFKKAFMTSPDSININRLEDGMYVSINNGFTRITGYTEEDILGKTSIEKNIWVDLADRDRLVQGLKEKGIVENLIAQFSTKSGGIIYGMMSASIIELNGVKHLLNITRDISDIRKTELALQKSKATLDTALASTTDAIFITDSEGNYIQFNEAFVKFTRFKNKDEVYTKFNHFTDILEVFNSNDEVAPPETWAVARALRGEIVNNFEYKLRRKDTGETWTGSYSFSPMRDDKGEIIGSVVVARDVTELKQTERILFESERRFRELLSAVKMISVILDLQGNIIFCNDFVLNLTGWTREEAIGKNWVENFLPPDAIENVRTVLENTRKHGNLITNNENTVLTKDGNSILVAWNNTVLFDENGLMNGIASLGVDITQNRMAEENLKKSQKLLSETEKLGNVGGWEYYYDSGKLNWTEETYNIHELDFHQNMVLDGAINFYTPDSIPIIENAVQQAIKQGQPFDLELQIITAKGNLRNVHSIGKPDKEHRRIFGFFQDITERKQAEKALSESEEKLRTLFASMTEMVAMHELVFNEVGEAINYRIIDCNDAFCRTIGIEKENIVGKLADEFYQTEKAPFLETYTRVAITGESFGHNIYYQPLDKYLLISSVSTGKNRFSTIITDITAMEQVKEIILDKNKELENYIYAASHDLRSPLVNIQGFSQRLKKQTEEIKMALSANGQGEIKLDNLEELTIDAIPKTLNFILSNVTKMDALINGLLQISRTGRVTMAIKKVKMNNLFKTINQHYSFEITEIDATINIDDLPDCYGDENQLNRLFSNIIGNALKYRDSNRKLEVNISAKINYNKVVYCIADNGIGIASRNIEKIWNVFYRVDSTVSEAGDGIGLSLVKRIADKHKGKVWAESEEGKGSRFYVELQKNEFEE
ncbi:MAG: PAS domain S-box protein, partial [Paludibacter sp.]